MITSSLPPIAACLLAISCKPAEKETAPATPAADAFLILPGDYAEATTAADLETRFGKTNVRRETSPEPRVVLFPDDPSRRAYVTFHDDAAFSHLASISVTDPDSRWRGKHGVHIGMTFAKVRELNGKPFNYQGFDAAKSARVHDSWSPALDGDDGKLGAFDVSEGDRLYFEVHFGIRGPSENIPIDDYPSSDDPRFPDLGGRAFVTGISSSSSLDDEWQ